MKRILKALSGFAVVVAAVCLMSAPAQARVFVNFGFGFPLCYGPAYYPAYRYYCAPPAYYYYGRPYGYYYGPYGHYYYRGGGWYYR
ncbi:MAG TPA: hypothetical protein VMV72_04705 [Verrucomicrobiae bacterium]|nr:hypothetical protein [Verrucomicrobiae bacterium]